MCLVYIKLLETEKEKNLFFELRHKVFTEEMGWTKSKRKETDRFDINAIFLGVFYNNTLVSCTRMITYQYEWMFDSVFAHLLKEPIVKSPDMIELTRYFVHPNYRKIQIINGNKFLFSKLLQQSVVKFCRLHSISSIYCVFSYRVFRLFQFQNVGAVNLNEDIAIGDDLDTPVPVVMRSNDTDFKKFFAKEFFDFVHLEFLHN